MKNERKTKMKISTLEKEINRLQGELEDKRDLLIRKINKQKLKELENVEFHWTLPKTIELKVCYMDYGEFTLIQDTTDNEYGDLYVRFETVCCGERDYECSPNFKEVDDCYMWAKERYLKELNDQKTLIKGK